MNRVEKQCFRKTLGNFWAVFRELLVLSKYYPRTAKNNPIIYIFIKEIWSNEENVFCSEGTEPIILKVCLNVVTL